MSELKVYEEMEDYVGYDECDCTPAKMYDKSEADKVIAEMKKACKDKDDWCLHTLKELRHHKYKRCLAMAEMCRTNAVLADLLSPKRTSRKFICWKNRYEKFLELADKFKEAK